MLNKTSSIMWDNWYFPTFLLSDGSFNLVYLVSLFVPVRLCDSLPKMQKTVQTGKVTHGVGTVTNGGRCPKMFL